MADVRSHARWLLVTLASAGCADEGEGDLSSPAGNATTEQGAGGEQSDAERREDEDAAEAALLVLDDFPAGWEAEPAENDEADDDDIRSGLEDCLGTDESEPDTDGPSVSSPTFTSPNEEEVTAEVTLTPSAGDASRTIERLESDAAPGCYAEAFRAVIERNLQARHAGGCRDRGADGREDLVRNLGDGSLAFRATLPVSVEGTDVAVFLDIVLVRVGRAGIETSFSSELTPFDTDESERLTGIVVDRVAAADLG